MQIFVNGLDKGIYDLAPGTVWISPDGISRTEDEIYVIEGVLNGSFVPAAISPDNPDQRELSVILQGIHAIP